MRSSGILMHISSLPSPYGMGTLGKEAYRFVDFLASAGQKNWQILPLSPTGYGDSPYQSCSTFAGNPYFIDLDRLVERGYITQDEINALYWGNDPSKVDYEAIYHNRDKILRLAFSRFQVKDTYTSFLRRNGDWLWDYSLFMALKASHNGAPWYTWEEPLKHRDVDALWQARQELKDEIEYYCFCQYLFHRQWKKLKAYAEDKGIAIIGDVPIYVPMDSVEVWVDPDMFCLDASLNPEAVAGVPPDAFSDDGQLWGNPLYRWSAHENDGFAWWIRRLKAAAKLYDVVRLDHFRGFEAYWEVPYGDQTARGGRWVKGPASKFMRAIQKALPQTAFIAEDLGVITPEVEQMKQEAGFPGMAVLEFAFDSRTPSEYLPHNHTPNTVCYVGTHDNAPAVQWFRELSPDSQAYATEYMALSQQEGILWGVIRTALSSVANTTILQMQDLLGVEGRMNLPGTFGSPNWCWRMTGWGLDGEIADRLLRMTKLFDR